MKSFWKNKTLLVTGIILAALLAVGIISNAVGFNPVNTVVRTVLSPFQSGVSYIADKIYGTVKFIWEMDGYKEENERLTEELLDQQSKNRDVSQYREENERLRDLLDLQQSLTTFSSVAAPVIGYSESGSYDEIEIGKGTINGIAVGNTVIADDGVVGIVSEVGANWAMVTTMLNENNAMGVKIVRTGDIAVLEGDKELAADGLCKMTFVDSSVNIIVGDIIETSGSGGIYPAGLQVGSITEIKSDNMGQIDYAAIKPNVDLKSLHEVLVINGVLE
ncbi:MAG: rod shape-determining protein MreC [Firmicutes bacterium]|nr:rod shape-determining protein MreC [Bacillota bacterium]